MTKLNIAIEIVKANSDKKQAIEAIMEELSVTKANAFVYWTKAAKATGIEVPVRVAKEKAEKVERKFNPVTETTPEKAAVKIAEIDAVIANLRKVGAVSPFPVAA